ncbi:outer membrane protein assembly factor BamD [Paucihalobacter sp.]|uniref:outer membrane protein assembly factor BamD n=1 Tax=Paucihalobacter sp. TaxID=2850405 RepID=UPI003D161AB9
MKNTVYILSFLLVLTSCSDFQKALKSEDTATKFQLGTTLFEEGKWNKANRLFAQIVPEYRGKPQAEKLMYMYAMTFYNMEDFYLSAYQLERFESSYPNSEKVEEAGFLAAKSAYKISPIYSKEQKETIEAIEKLQLFINRYPDSQYLSEANNMVKELDLKLERKAYEIAKQYNKITDYSASIKSCENFILEFPGSVYREDIFFVRLDSAYKFAINSVESKKQDRIKEALTYFQAFKKSYPKSGNMELAESMNTELVDLQQQVNTKS